MKLEDLGVLPEHLTEAPPAEWPRLTAIAFIVVLTGALLTWFVFGRAGRVPPRKEAYALPSAMTLPASTSAIDLVHAIDALDTMASTAQKRLVVDDDVDPTKIAQMYNRLDTLESQVKAMKPQLNAEEQRIVPAVLGASLQIRALIASFQGKSPDLDGKYIVLARRELGLARGLLTSAPAMNVKFGTQAP